MHRESLLMSQTGIRGKTSGVGWSHRDIYRENIEGGAGLQPLSSVGEEAA